MIPWEDSKAKIGNFSHPTFEENIGNFEIPMNYSKLIEIDEPI